MSEHSREHSLTQAGGSAASGAWECCPGQGQHSAAAETEMETVGPSTPSTVGNTRLGGAGPTAGTGALTSQLLDQEGPTCIKAEDYRTFFNLILMLYITCIFLKDNKLISQMFYVHYTDPCMGKIVRKRKMSHFIFCRCVFYLNMMGKNPKTS